MATRMQQRRGTAQQWLDADPVLAAGEMGFETDTNEFRIGDGVNVWSDLSPFKNLEDLGGSLDDYVPVSTKGQANGVASLDSSGNVPAAQLANVIGGAGAALDTLNEISAALNNDSSYAATIVSALATKAGLTYVDLHKNATTSVHGIADTSALATKSYADTAVSNHDADTTMVHGISDTGNLVYSEDISDFIVLLDASTAAASAVSTHSADTTDVHGIANTANLATKSYADAAADGAADAAEAAAITAAGTAADSKIATHSDDITNVHGIADTSLLATKSYADGKASDAQTAATSAAATAADTKISTHNSDTTDVHGIADTSALALTATVNSALALKAPLASPTFTGTVTLPDNTISQRHLNDDSVGTNEIGGLAVTTGKIADGAVTSAKIANDTIVDADINASAAIATSKISGLDTALGLKAPLASPTFTGTVTLPSGTVTSGMILDGTIVDADINASAAIAQSKISGLTTDLGLKAPLASPALTGVPTAPLAATGTNTTQVATTSFVQQELSILTTGAPALLNTLDELAAALGDDANYASTVTTALSTKAPLASPTFTGTVSGITKSMVGLGSVDNTADTAKPISTATQTALDAKAPLASPTFTGTVTLPSAGIVFSDGTQAKAGVPSITTFGTSFAATGTLAAGEQDKFIPVAGTVTITLPATGYSTGQSIDFYQASGTGAAFASTNSVVGTPGLKFRTTNSVVTAMKTSGGWLVFGDLSA